MLRRGTVLALALLAGAPAGLAAPRDRDSQASPRHHLRLRPDIPWPGYVPPPEPEPLPPLPEPRVRPPRIAPYMVPAEPSAPLPSGFTMTLVQGQEPDPARDEAIGKPRDIARRLAACWAPPQFDGPPAEITLRLQFSKAGQIIGQPQISYVAAPKDERSKVVESMKAALKDCTPLRFTARLGAGIAGYPFAIRFIAAERKKTDQP